MKICNTCKTAIPLGDFPKHKSRKDGYAETCKKCRSQLRRERYASDVELREKIKQRGAARYLANREQIDAQHAVYRAANLDRFAERNRIWYHSNHEAAKASRRASTAKWLQGEKGKAYMAQYYADNKLRFIDYRARNAKHIAEGKQLNYTLNKAAVLRQMKAYYQANKPYILTRNRKYQLENPEIVKRSKTAWYYRNPGCGRMKEMRRRVKIRLGTTHPITATIIGNLWSKQKGLCIYCRTKLGNSPKDTRSYHVDHIHPISKGGTNQVDNLQCLCPPCNLKKGAKLPHEFAQQLGRLF